MSNELLHSDVIISVNHNVLLNYLVNVDHDQPCLVKEILNRCVIFESSMKFPIVNTRNSIKYIVKCIIPITSEIFNSPKIISHVYPSRNTQYVTFVYDGTTNK